MLLFYTNSEVYTKSGIDSILKSRYKVTFLILFILYPLITLIQILYHALCTGINDLIPYFAFYLTGNGADMTIICIYFWLFPIYLLILSGDDVITDYKTGYHTILSTKSGKRAYLRSRMLYSFVTCFATVGVSLLLDLALAMIFMRNGTYSPNQNNSPSNILYTWSLTHPFLADLGFTLVTCFIAGLTGMMGTALCFLLKDRKYAYPASLAVWLLLILPDKSLLLAFQPFSEYGFSTLIPTLLFAIALLLSISILSYIYEANYVEV